MPVTPRNGRFQARYFAGYSSTGKRLYPSKTFDKKKDAVAWEAAHLNQKHTGLSTDPTTFTIRDCFLHWTANADIRRTSRNTYELYFRNYIDLHIGKIRITKLTPLQVESWIARLREQGLSAATISMARVLVSSMYRYAIAMRLCQVNPAAAVSSPTIERKEMYAFSPIEAKQFLSTAKLTRFGVLFSFALQTGLRPEEYQGLTWADLELDGARGRVNVRRTVINACGLGPWYFSKPKTKKGRRIVVFPQALALELAEHRRRQLEEKMRAGQWYESHDLVFANPLGKPFNRSVIRVEYKRILAKAGLPAHVRLYDLRHSFVTLSLIAGKDVKTVSTEAGHHSVAFTLDYYGHVLPVMQDAGCDKLEDLLHTACTP